MHGFHEKDGILHADDVALTDIAKEVGTPCYVYAASVIEEQYKRLSAALERALPKGRNPLLCFACKANSNLSVLSHLRALGSGLEIVSEGELIRGLRAGFDPKTIVATGVGKQRGEIAALLKAGILQINAESLPELERINEVAGEMGCVAEIAFRLNPNVSGGGHHKISTGRKQDKFGMDAQTLFRAYDMAAALPHATPVGISMHIGSQVFEVEKFHEAFTHIPQMVKDLRSKGHAVSRLDIGGGFPIIYSDEKLLDLDSYAQWVADIIAPLDTQIIMEPGRYLVGNAGVILTEVIYVKESGARNFLIIDAAMNDLIRPAMYDAYHAIEPVQEQNRPRKSYDIVGPVCETGDTFATGRSLPEMQAGELCVIETAGAYGASMGSNYNTRLLAPEVMVKGGKFAVIRPRQTYEEILSRESVPDWI